MSLRRTFRHTRKVMKTNGDVMYFRESPVTLEGGDVIGYYQQHGEMYSTG
jgi:hypothetical protein